MVTVLTFYSNNPSSNPNEVYKFSEMIFAEKNENKQKNTGVGQFLKTFTNVFVFLLQGNNKK